MEEQRHGGEGPDRDERPVLHQRPDRVVESVGELVHSSEDLRLERGQVRPGSDRRGEQDDRRDREDDDVPLEQAAFPNRTLGVSQGASS
jgi:hypothetical protein